MDIKILLTILSLASCSNCAGMLRRTPKVYNALITTDENLTPSRAFPVIQPTIHETGIAHYPYGPYNPYRIFHPPIVHLNSPTFESRQIPAFVQHHPNPSLYDHLPSAADRYQPQGSLYETNHIGLPQPSGQFSQQPSGPPHPVQMPQPQQQPLDPIPQQGYASYYEQPPQVSQRPQIESNLEEVEQKQDQQLPVIPAQTNEKQNSQIPLNEFGLPPSLIPLQSYQPHHPHISSPPFRDGPAPLQPFSFGTYPLIYDQYSHYHPGQEHYLPHFGYYPPHSYGIPIHRPSKNRPKNPSTIATSSTTPTTNVDLNLSSTDSVENVTKVAPAAQPINIGNIKNGIENKDKSIPDVPPPPLPAGAKTAQRIIAL